MSKSFGKLLSEACKTQGVSYSELARALGCSQPRITQILQSKSISERVFREVARTLDVDVCVELVPRAGAQKRLETKRTEASRRLRRQNGRE